MLMESVSTISFSDQRTTNWFMMSSPFPTLFICLSYVYGVKVLGPKLMENRKPFQLKNVLIVYNLFQMVFSAWLFYEVRFLLRPFLPPSLPPSLLSFLSSIFTLFSIYLLYWILLTSYESFFSILKCVACFEMPLVYKHVRIKFCSYIGMLDEESWNEGFMCCIMNDFCKNIECPGLTTEFEITRDQWHQFNL